MIRSESALFRTGQVWKFWLMPIGTILGAVILLWTEAHKNSLSGSEFFMALIFSVLVEAISLIFPIIGIRCPRCGARWLWIAVSRSGNDKWFHQLFQTSCPSCGFNGEIPIKRK
jgi:hypothetical protein